MKFFLATACLIISYLTGRVIFFGKLTKGPCANDVCTGQYWRIVNFAEEQQKFEWGGGGGSKSRKFCCPHLSKAPTGKARSLQSVQLTSTYTNNERGWFYVHVKCRLWHKEPSVHEVYPQNFQGFQPPSYCLQKGLIPSLRFTRSPFIFPLFGIPTLLPLCRHTLWIAP